jgi:hypothetical protein
LQQLFQLKIITFSSKCNTCCFVISASHCFGKEKINKKQQCKVDKQRFAMMTTSKGIPIINSPFKENMTKIINSKATNVVGEIAGINFSDYEVSPFALT